jgi:thiamine biosynthesis protein ThiI
MDPIAVHFHEIALKGKNRKVFEGQLRDNLHAALADLGDAKVRSVEGRVYVEIDVEPEVAIERINLVFGVAHCFVARRMERDLEKVAAHVIEAMRRREPASFRIMTRRNDKKYPKNSVEIDREIGALVKQATGVPVKLSGAELVAHVILLNDEILVGTDKREGPGGLPVGTGGRVAALLSGGIDSPVAAWRMMKRGCHVDLVHFHSHPLVDRRSIEKAEELTEVLTRWQLRSRLHLVPLSEMQTAARLHAPEPLRVLLYRRFMVRIAEAIARRNKCRALVTGESLGQVASQTLSNLAAVDAVATLPVLRPLVGFDKQEIIDEAERLETFDISVQPDQDCCRLFLPKKPAIHASAAQCAEAEEALDVTGLVTDALSRTETETFRWPEA